MTGASAPAALHRLLPEDDLAPAPAAGAGRAARAPLRSGKALVMGDDTRGFLATVRSLGRQGITVHAAPFDFRSPALASRYIRAIHDVPPWMEGGEAWLRAMRTLLAAERFDLVIPCDERNLLPMQRFREEFSGLTRLAIPNDEAIAVLFDKYSTRRLAEDVGVAVARGRLAGPAENPFGLLEEFGSPVVVKPRRSYTMDGLAKRGRVHLTADPSLLAELLGDAEPDSLILESCFEGSGLGVSVLAHRGKLLQAFEHHRVHERSGSSFYRVSAAPAPELVEACAAMANGVAFTGVAMFEFKRGLGGDWILLEVNARPWGSLPLPVSLGVDFPYRWYQLLVDGAETPPVAYPVGIYGRNFVPDMVSALAEAQGRGIGLPGRALALGHRLLGLRTALIGKEKQDVLVGDDRAPALAEAGSIWSGALSRAWRAAPGSRALGEARARALVRRLGREKTPVHVLFACQGNICRSPYAAAVLRDVDAGGGRVVVTSAGMMPRRDRPMPALFQAQARSEGLDLAAHRSQWLERAAVDAADLIVVFDRVNVAAVLDRYPDRRRRLLMLGDLIGVGEIEDPVDGDAAFAAVTYGKIRRGIEALVALLLSRRD